MGSSLMTVLSFMKFFSMGKSMGLEVESEHLNELLKSHEIELNTEERQHLLEEQQRTLADDLSSDEDEVMESVPSYYLRKCVRTEGKCSYLWKNIVRTTC